MKIFQKGFNYNQDGKGNRLVYHLQGCNFSCPWCSNPESIPFSSYQNAKQQSEIIDNDKIIKQCLESRPLFYDGGGVTFTGGEPTLQFPDLLYILKALKQADINTAVETNGSYKDLPLLLPFIDELIIDCKHYNNDIFKQWIKNDNFITLKNIIFASKTHKNLLIRIPLINGFNTGKEDIAGFIKLLSPLNVKVELLKYHEYGKVKWEQCGLSYNIINGYVNNETYDLFVSEMIKSKIRIINT